MFLTINKILVITTRKQYLILLIEKEAEATN